MPVTRAAVSHRQQLIKNFEAKSDTLEEYQLLIRKNLTELDEKQRNKMEAAVDWYFPTMCNGFYHSIMHEEWDDVVHYFSEIETEEEQENFINFFILLSGIQMVNEKKEEEYES